MLRPEVVRWFNDRRGIRRETLEAFGVTSTSDIPIVYPYPGGAKKLRATLEKDESGHHRMWWDPQPSGDLPPFLPPDFEPGPRMLLVEGETDTMALWQNTPPEIRKHLVGIPGVNGLQGALSVLEPAKQVMVVFDRDDPYENPNAVKSVETAWSTVKQALGAIRARRVLLPPGINDVAEFFQRYDWEAFRVLLRKASEVTYPFQPLDLKAPLPDFDYLVQDLLLRGEIVMIDGEPGLGKSWVAQDLAVKLAQGEGEWLGHEIRHFGRVLYVDQENPLVTARHRLTMLGLTDDGIPNMHYLWFQGVRLDTEPERLVEHVELWQPELVVIDSLSAVHFRNENSGEEMNPLLRASVFPITRELGATAIVIHHTPKEGKGPRGHSSIQGAMDLTLEIREQSTKKGDKTGRYLMLPDKLRNVAPWGSALVFERRDEDGRMVIEPSSEEEPW